MPVFEEAGVLGLANFRNMAVDRPSIKFILVGDLVSVLAVILAGTLAAI